MSWSLGYDLKWERDIGYGVPAYCDAPLCNNEIDRGLAYVCGGEPYGGDNGCGLYFCYSHLNYDNLCNACSTNSEPYDPKEEHPDWINHKLTDERWGKWREKNKELVLKLKKKLQKLKEIENEKNH